MAEEMVTSDDTEKKNNRKDSMEILEEALVMCKFGKFHIMVIFATLNSSFSFAGVNATSSYILPNAECDLNMTIMQKGLLSAMPFCGHLSVSLFMGFITDIFGRRKSLITGNFGIFICSIIEGSSQNYLMMITAKLFEGISVGFAISVSAVMLTELISKDIRDRAMVFFGATMSLSFLITTLLSWALLPQSWYFVLWKGYFVLHSWNIFIYVNSIWSISAGVIYYYLPESPKFLLRNGQENEALEVLTYIYSMNTGLSRDTFPIKSLKTEGEYKPTQKNGFKKQIVNGLFEFKTIFQMPLSLHLLQFTIGGFIYYASFSSLRMWFPQISTIVDNYQLKHNETQSFCIMISEYSKGLVKNDLNIVSETPEICIPQISGSNTYINGIILGLVSLSFNSINGYLVSFVGPKILMFVSLLLCAVCSGCLYLTNASIQIALLLSATSGLVHAVISLQRSIAIRVFPTSVRTITLTIIMTTGRIGSVLGNLVFPIALQAGCMVPFWIVSGLAFGAATMVYFLPNPQKQNVTSDK